MLILGVKYFVRRSIAIRITGLAVTFILAASTTLYCQKKEPGYNVAEQQIRKLEREWTDAAVKKDIGTLDRLMADDFIATSFTGQVRDKATWLKEAPAPADTKVLSIEKDDVRIKVYGDAAVVTGRQTRKTSNKGNVVVQQRRFTHFYIKRQGHWQVVATQLTLIPQTE